MTFIAEDFAATTNPDGNRLQTIGFKASEAPAKDRRAADSGSQRTVRDTTITGNNYISRA